MEAQLCLAVAAAVASVVPMLYFMATSANTEQEELILSAQWPRQGLSEYVLSQQQRLPILFRAEAPSGGANDDGSGAMEGTPWAAWRRTLSLDVLLASDSPFTTTLSQSSTFGYHAQEGAHHLLADLESTFTPWDTTLGAAARRAHERTPSAPYVYGSAPLSNLSPRIQAAASGWEALAVHEAREERTVGLASLWLGGANVTTQLHYDVDHNTHVQLIGRKRWLIFPPSASRLLSMYGFLHPRYSTPYS